MGGGDNSWQHTSKLNPSRQRFTSYDRSASTGLDYAVNRYYSTAQGRFTQVDPIGMSAASLTDPQSLNLYAYCGNDPINRVDPDGLFWGGLFKWLGKALKWIGIAVAVAALIVSGPFAPAAGSVLGQILSTLVAFGAKIGLAANFLSGGVLLAEGAEAAATLGAGVLVAAGAAVGAVSNLLQSKQKQQAIDTTGKTPCLWKNVRITYYDKPKGTTPFGRSGPVEGRTAAGDPTAFGFEYPRGKKYPKNAAGNQERIRDLRTRVKTQDILHANQVVFDIPGEGPRVFEDVGGLVKGAHIDVYVEANAKGRKDVDVTVYVPNGIPCPQGSTPK